jgi:magnesium-transporting ATPase (P-type)
MSGDLLKLPSVPRRLGLDSLAFLATIFMLSLALNMLRPWSNESFATDGASHLYWSTMLLYAVSPNAGLALLSRMFRSDRKAFIAFVIGASAISIVGVYAYFHALVLHRSALSGLILLFAPTYQWFAITVLTIVCLAIKRLREMRDEEFQVLDQ